jgi:Zn-dependent protease with chaperone function
MERIFKDKNLELWIDEKNLYLDSNLEFLLFDEEGTFWIPSEYKPIKKSWKGRFTGRYQYRVKGGRKYVCVSLDEGNPWVYMLERHLAEIKVYHKNPIVNRERDIFSSDGIQLYHSSLLPGQPDWNVLVLLSEGKSSISNKYDRYKSSPVFRNGEKTGKYVVMVPALFSEDFMISSEKGIFFYKDGKVTRSNEEEFWEFTGRTPIEYLRSKGVLHYLKNTLSTNPQLRLSLYLTPLIFGLAAIYPSPNFLDYVVTSEVLNFLGYLFSKPLIEKTLRVEWGRFPYERELKELARKMGVKVDKVGVGSWGRPSAFTYTSLIPFRRHIVFSRRLIEKLTKDEVLAVGAHELGHLKKGHNLKMYLVSSLLLPFSCLNFWILFREFEWLKYLLVGVACAGLGSLQSRISKNFEYEADKLAVTYTNEEDFLQGLRKCIPERFSYIPSFSHPSYDERESKLLEMYMDLEDEKGKKVYKW